MRRRLVSHPSDALERQADRAAAPRAGLPVRSLPTAMRAASLPPVVNDAIRSSGEPLDPSLRAELEPRLGHDFGSVRVHADSGAHRSAAALNARAYTVGTDVVFGAGQYAPSSSAGRELIAHELSHVVQQASGAATPAVQRKIQSLYGQPLKSYFKKAGLEPRLSDGIYSLRKGKGSSLEQQIVIDLLSSQRVFTILGESEKAAGNSLAKHVQTRKGIVEFAKKPKRYRFATGVKGTQVNEDYWKISGGRLAAKENVNLIEAAKDLNVKGEKYAVSCEVATTLIVAAGSGNSPIVEDDPVAEDDWVPGDWGYIENTKRDKSKVDDAYAGENIISLGFGQFWGHISSDQTIKTLPEWMAEVNKWGEAKFSSARKYPRIGLI